LEESLILKEKYGFYVAVISMGPPNTEVTLRKALGLGADEVILLSDRAIGAGYKPGSCRNHQEAGSEGRGGYGNLRRQIRNSGDASASNDRSVARNKPSSLSNSVYAHFGRGCHSDDVK
jgi:hypothetical protein